MHPPAHERFRPIAYGRPELLVARLIFAWAAWNSFPAFTTFAEQPDPVGLAHFLDFTWLASDQPALFGWTPLEWVRATLAVALVVYVTGFLDLVALPVVLFALVSIGTLNNSQGAITHHFQVISLVALGQFGFACLRPGIRRRPAWDGEWLIRERWVAFVSQQAIVGTYVVTAITKIVTSGFPGWILDARYFPLQLVKTDRMHYFNTLTDEGARGAEGWTNGIAARLQELFLSSPAAASAFIGAGLLLELFAFLALLGRRWNLAVGLLLIAFHLTVSAAMSLTFTFNMVLLAGYFVIPPIIAGIREWSRRRTRRQSPSRAHAHARAQS